MSRPERVRRGHGASNASRRALSLNAARALHQLAVLLGLMGVLAMMPMGCGLARSAQDEPGSLDDAGMSEPDTGAAGEEDGATAQDSGTSQADATQEEAGSDLGLGDPDTGAEPLVVCDGDEPGTVRPEGWGRESHCRGVDPDYERLFADDVVHRIDICITPEDYLATMEDLDDKLSGGGPGGLSFENPIWVPVILELRGLTWWHVGMRYKGNSSLKAAWTSGIRKLSFRLNFDKYEDDHPEVDDQRFFGFKKMTFSNGFKDRSLIRDKLAADIFRAGGVPAARGAFVRVHVDHGEGPVYFGLYTMIEDPSDEMLDVQFEDGGGNLYKPEGEGARWTRFVREHFPKKTNGDEEDFSDVIAAIEALHAARHDPAAWRAGLEAFFDVQAFLRCLALNQAMVNWDSYGFMDHNYYIYGDPGRGDRLVWFPWDLNEAMLVPRRMPGGADPSSVMLDEIRDGWPLIRYLLDDPVYRELYRGELRHALEGAFAIERVHALMDAYHALIAPYVVGPEAEETRPYTHLRRPEDFEDSLTRGPDALKPHVEARQEAVLRALGEPR